MLFRVTLGFGCHSDFRGHLPVGRLPLFRVDRTGTAIVGAALLIASGVL